MRTRKSQIKTNYIPYSSTLENYNGIPQNKRHPARQRNIRTQKYPINHDLHNPRKNTSKFDKTIHKQITKTIEAQKLVDAGFEYICNFRNDSKLFRKLI